MTNEILKDEQFKQVASGYWFLYFDPHRPNRYESGDEDSLTPDGDNLLVAQNII